MTIDDEASIIALNYGRTLSVWSQMPRLLVRRVALSTLALAAAASTIVFMTGIDRGGAPHMPV